MNRKLATIRLIKDIRPIQNADAIEVAVIDGWEVVIKKNQFKVGDYVMYFEIDSWIGTDLEPLLSKGKEPREYNGEKGERLRTVRLRGQISQGLVLDVGFVVFNRLGGQFYDGIMDMIESKDESLDGMDMTELLGIQKWEPKLNPQMQGKAKGNFPSHTPKTDAERAQNLGRTIENWFNDGIKWEVTEKIHGTSMTVYFDGDDVGVCSRNFDLKLDQEGNLYVDFAKQSGILDALRGYGKKLSIQGELAGGGIQPNADYHNHFVYYIFNIWDISEQRYLTPQERYDIILELGIGKNDNISHAPLIDYGVELKSSDVKELLLFADGESKINPKYNREGLVYKSLDGKHLFKTVSNVWLEKHD